MEPLQITLFDSDKAPQGRRHALSWPQLVEWLSKPMPANVPKSSLPMWSPATFKDDRRAKANVERVDLLAFDVDEDPVPGLEAIGAALQGVSWFAHSSSSALVGSARWRLVIALSRPVNVEEHAHVWRVVTARLPFPVGAASKDPSRAWYVARTGADGTFETGGGA